MSKKACRNKKINNAGLTLIEILVAIALLSIAMVPLMYSFVNVARQNVRARDLQQTSILAHTVIENCKEFTVDEMVAAVGSGTFISNASASINDTVHVGANEYTFHFDNVKMYDDGAGNASNQVYDISVKLVPYANSTGVSTQKIMSYEDMNAYTDAVFMANTNMSTGTPSYKAEELDGVAYDEVLLKIQEKVKNDSTAYGPEITLDVADIHSSLDSGINANKLEMNREIIVDVSEVSGVDYVDVTYKYTYAMNSNFKYEVVEEDLTNPGNYITSVKTVNCNDSSWSYEREFPIYNNSNTYTETGITIENVYLFYYPGYNKSVTYPIKNEQITINNDPGEPLKLYLMKQVKPGISNVDLQSAESTYKPKVSATSVNDVLLYHNLDTNIAGGGTVAWEASAVSGSIERNEETVEGDGDTVATGTEKRLMYTVWVGIYDENSYDATEVKMTTNVLATMDGTCLNW